MVKQKQYSAGDHIEIEGHTWVVETVVPHPDDPAVVIVDYTVLLAPHYFRRGKWQKREHLSIGSRPGTFIR